MKRLNISDEIITLTTEGHPYERDAPWSLRTDSIRVIGICNTLILDDDTDIIIFIDSELNSYKLTMSYISNQDLANLYLLLRQKFKLNFDMEVSKIEDTCVIVFPAVLYSQPLYEKNWFQNFLCKIGFKDITGFSFTQQIKSYLMPSQRR